MKKDATKSLRNLNIIVWSIVIIVLITSTILEKHIGTDVVQDKIYGSGWFVFLWLIAAISALCYLFRKKLYLKTALFLLHLSFLVILLGGLMTYLTALNGTIHITKGIETSSFINKDETTKTLPFSVSLDNFEILYYEGTSSPADYVSTVSVKNKNGELLKKGSISMNNILSVNGYRFYQSGFDEDLNGCTLMVAHDPWGISISYCGYGLLIIAILLFIITDKSFHTLMKSTTVKTVSACLLLFAFHTTCDAANAPKVLPKDVAEKFGDLYVEYNGRICPLQTFAKDFTVKLYGKPEYKGYTPEQVLTGWMFFYSDWKEEPMIKTKSGEIRDILEIDGKYACLEDFRGIYDNYKLQDAMDMIHRGTYEGKASSITAADEKFNLITGFYSGKMLKIYPIKDENNFLRWYYQADNLPENIDSDEWFFVRKSMDYIYELIVGKDYTNLYSSLDQIKKYQEKNAKGQLPPAIKTKTEKAYNQYANIKLVAFPALLIGMLLFIYSIVCLAKDKSINKHILNGSVIIVGILLLMLTAIIAMRWIVGGHIPLANGSETMIFMAWCALLFSLVFYRRFNNILPLGLIVSGLTMMVSIMSNANPQITLLMPVLASPLLSIHVAVIMLAYVLLTFMMLNGISAVVMNLSVKDNQEPIERMYLISRKMLYPAIFLLAIGIFIGAIWANVSWGTYWSWDPKETWALITMLIYAFAIHSQSIPLFRKPMAFHIFTILAFLSVLITYFGVNYFLGGMHSYV